MTSGYNLPDWLLEGPDQKELKGLRTTSELSESEGESDSCENLLGPPSLIVSSIARLERTHNPVYCT
jgi:hypothetical protein